jgi:hypothetical protein
MPHALLRVYGKSGAGKGLTLVELLPALSGRRRLKAGRFANLLTPDAAHGSRRGDKIRLANAVPRLFLPDYFTQIITKFSVASSIPKERPDIVFRDAEQASANLSVRRQPNAIAMAAEGLAHGSNDSEFACTVIDSPAPRRFRSIARNNGLKTEAFLQAVDNLLPRNEVLSARLGPNPKA